MRSHHHLVRCICFALAVTCLAAVGSAHGDKESGRPEPIAIDDERVVLIRTIFDGEAVYRLELTAQGFRTEHSGTFIIYELRKTRQWPDKEVKSTTIWRRFLGYTTPQPTWTLFDLCYDLNSSRIYLVSCHYSSFQITSFELDSVPVIRRDGSTKLDGPLPANITSKEIEERLRAKYPKLPRTLIGLDDVPEIEVLEISISTHGDELTVLTKGRSPHEPRQNRFAWSLKDGRSLTPEWKGQKPLRLEKGDKIDETTDR